MKRFNIKGTWLRLIGYALSLTVVIIALIIGVTLQWTGKTNALQTIKLISTGFQVGLDVHFHLMESLWPQDVTNHLKFGTRSQVER